MPPRRYTNAAGFKHALEQRLRAATPSGLAFARRRQLLVFDRFLARVVRVFEDSVTLKGGLVLEFRLNRARTTRDVDLRFVGPPLDVLQRLEHASQLDLGDFMRFQVRADSAHPEIQNDGMKYDGLRFRAECDLAGRIYGAPFGVDVAFGDPITGEPDVVVTDDVLGFAGITPPTLRLYPVETHLAEKLHAYTLPRARPNTRIKDLPDIALLAMAREIDSTRLRAALEQTFAFRGTHPLPYFVPEPPAQWQQPYAKMAREDALPWPTLDALTMAVRAFLGPVLVDSQAGTWAPERWTWNVQP
ncbi:nucleotidyl transferase AbiEii/AbiGii toxin family protein [Myxococcus sp. MxC21-1]|uniref:nucleotidyl transferase AbiEii/AbiGii toxin family protein n=1 Tax=Myxococcus sp. MxC21-1 TaxID=3041439 RepID=UPI00292DC106|nr:nucleotidyl transferase AbiEii/AbiGii toxin family protein [Myxococcus sp. MxC21-1]WNZ62220.1 nucleotidyl transferase AbiEii/AbiGii toxin family protein [Myxococcus sp. MxC21-1]